MRKGFTLAEVLVTLIVIGFIAFIALCTYYGPNLHEFFGTRYENAQSNIMQNNISYIRGKAEHLTRLKLEYNKETDLTVKAAIKSTYIEELSTIDNNKLPVNLLNIEN